MNFTHTINNITFNISYTGYTKVGAAMRAMIITVMTIAAGLLKLPEHVTIEFINSGSWAYRRDKKVNGQYLRETNTIQIFKLSAIQMPRTLAHELGHAEHFYLHPESSKEWAEVRREEYAITVSALITALREKGSLPEFYRTTDDIRVFEGRLLRK